ncbi:MAG TPA: hypothetical protein VF916_12055 [Ktedonobacterales bacterium]
MTKVREQPGAPAESTAPAGNTGPAGWLSRVGQVLVPRPTAAQKPAAPGTAATPSTERPRLGRGLNRLLVGVLAYIIGSYVLQVLLVLANGYLHLGLEQRQALFPATTPLVGAMTKFSLIYFILVIVLIWLLFRFGLIPRDPFGARAAAQRGATQQNTTASATTSYSSRRRAARRQASAATPTASVARTQSNAKRVAVPARTPARAPARTPATTTATASTNDDEYERVKALQRARRRKR